MSTTFNTLNDVKKKQRFLLLLDVSTPDNFSVIAYSTNANLSFSADDVDVSNKMDGSWATTMQGKKSAEISVDALCSTKFGEVGLQQIYNDDATYKFLYGTFSVKETGDGTGTQLMFDATEPYYMGNLKVSSLELTSDNGDVCKYSCTANSVGHVEEYTQDDFFAKVTWTGINFTVVFRKLINGAYLGDTMYSNVDQTDLRIEITCDGKTAKEGEDYWTFAESSYAVAGKLMEIKVYENGTTLIHDELIKVPDDISSTSDDE